ncbi:unnamed protein product [Symbiodinium sp. CCMP2592]|nr:unnamed protein product [Symbiodinium sp. CCMP2592]
MGILHRLLSTQVICLTSCGGTKAFVVEAQRERTCGHSAWRFSVLATWIFLPFGMTCIPSCCAISGSTFVGRRPATCSLLEVPLLPFLFQFHLGHGPWGRLVGPYGTCGWFLLVAQWLVVSLFVDTVRLNFVVLASQDGILLRQEDGEFFVIVCLSRLQTRRCSAHFSVASTAFDATMNFSNFKGFVSSAAQVVSMRYIARCGLPL